MNKYIYDGPVSESDHLITNNWHGETWANSASKAKSNLAYQFKMETGRVARSKITIPGKLIIVEGDE